MGTIADKNLESHGDDHIMEEEIGVEVKKLLRRNMSGTVPMPRELTEEEKVMFADSLVGSLVEQMVPSSRKERKLMKKSRHAAKKCKTSKKRDQKEKNTKKAKKKDLLHRKRKTKKALRRKKSGKR